jgi:2-methylcitrate dehydratase PrpD
VIDGNPLRSHCVQYVLAVVAHHGRVGFTDIMTDLRSDPAIASLSERITIVGDDTLDERAAGLRQSVGSITEVTTYAGATFTRDIEHPLGAAENPLSARDLQDKFAKLTAGILDDGRAVEIKRVIDELETLTDVNDLTRLLGVRSPQSRAAH